MLKAGILVAGISLLAAGLGASAAIYFGKEGPVGPRGAEGLTGPPGESATEALGRADEAMSQAEEAAELVEEVTSGLDALEGRVSDLELPGPIGTTLQIRLLRTELSSLAEDLGEVRGQLAVICFRNALDCP